MRPTEITGFLGQYQMQFLESNIRQREQNFLRAESAVVSNGDLIALDHGHIRMLSTFAIPVVCQTPELRAHYLQRFIDAGIESRPMIAGNIQLQPFYRKYVKQMHDLPGADFLHHNGFYCGNDPELTDEDLDTITGCLRA